jgi:hypothetical protein
MIKTVFMATFLIVAFGGCVADYFTLGKAQTYCEENGCDYTDAGVCKNPFDIIKDKEKYNKESYYGIKCENKGEN